MDKLKQNILDKNVNYTIFKNNIYIVICGTLII